MPSKALLPRLTQQIGRMEYGKRREAFSAHGFYFAPHPTRAHNTRQAQQGFCRGAAGQNDRPGICDFQQSIDKWPANVCFDLGRCSIAGGAPINNI